MSNHITKQYVYMWVLCLLVTFQVYIDGGDYTGYGSESGIPLRPGHDYCHMLTHSARANVGTVRCWSVIIQLARRAK